MEAVLRPLALVVGLASSLHCVGMCGGFSVALGAATPRSRRRLWLTRVVLYHVGRVFTYCFLGAVAGQLGGRLQSLQSMQRGVSILAGAVLVWVGLELCGQIPAHSSRLLRPLALVSHGMKVSLARRDCAGPFFVGLANGFLPCGAVLAMLALAVHQGRAAQGMITMAMFGAGTVPALFAVAWLSSSATRRLSPRAVHLSGWLIVGLGLVTMVRGQPFDPIGADCCSDSPQGTPAALAAPALEPHGQVPRVSAPGTRSAAPASEPGRSPGSR